jgi:malate permease and related proteins
MVLSALLIFAIIPFEKELFVAMLLAYTLPAPFIIPLYATDNAHKAYISTTLSIQTLVSLALFIGIAAYTLV